MNFFYALRMLRHLGSAGRWERGCLAVFVLATLLGAVCLADRRWSRFFIWLALIAALLGLGAAFWLTLHSRAADAELTALPSDIDRRSWASLSVAATVLAIAIVPFTFVSLRAVPHVGARVLGWIGCALVAVAAVWMLFMLELGARWLSYSQSYALETFGFEYWRDGLAEHRLRIDAGRWILAGVLLGGVVIGLPVLLRALLDGDWTALGARGRAACVAVFLLGAAAFWGTRAQARDAVNPLPPPTPELICGLAEARIEALPLEHGECGAALGPIVEVSAGGLWIDGTRMSGEEELVGVLRNKRDLWRQLNPGEPYPGKVIIAASSGETERDVATARRAARRAHYRRIGRLTRLPTETVSTHTLGELARSARCCASFD